MSITPNAIRSRYLELVGIRPEEIRAVRVRLGLSQVEAGEIIGGGPRAFTKYESGALKPSAAVLNLLRILDADPSAVATLRGPRSVPMVTGTTSVLSVTGQHIAVLTERIFVQLLRRLLYAEAIANGIPADGIQVASNVTASDGGEDGRITWQDGPERTSFLPSRINQFQLKAGKISPGAAAKDVLSRTGVVKEMVGSVLLQGGNYVMLCAETYVEKQVKAREDKIREALRAAGSAIQDDQVAFRDADQIASWVNAHPSVAAWVKEQTQPGAVGPFCSWSHWAGRTEHENSPWIEDDRLYPLRAFLRERVTQPRQFLRVVGLSGVGKSRLLLEALGATDEEVAADAYLSDLVLYADLSELSGENVITSVQHLSAMGERAIVIVDNCDPETHQVLVGHILRNGSRLSLVTVDNEVPTGTLDGDTLRVEQASDTVIEGIFNHVSGGLPNEDLTRLIRFSRGFPKIAVMLGHSWGSFVPVAHVTDQHLVDLFILGRSPREPDLLRKTCALLAAVGPVGVEPPADSQLEEIASFGRDLSADDLRVGLVDQVERGVAQRIGRFAVLQPRPIALKLAERQWLEWSPDRWDQLLAGESSPNLRISAARQLALLNTTDVSQKVVNHVCRLGGPFEGSRVMLGFQDARVLCSLVEVNPEVVVHLLERCFDQVNDLAVIVGETRRELVRTLEKAAFRKANFPEASILLLRLAVAENEIWANNAPGKFKELFPLLLGNTAATGQERLAILDEAAETDNQAQMSIVVEALLAGSETAHFFRIGGAESQGSLPALNPWHPANDEEALAYIEGCIRRLARMAVTDDSSGCAARSGLGVALSGLVLDGFIDLVEDVVNQVSSAGVFWSEATTGLRGAISIFADELDEQTTDRIRGMLEVLQPKTLETRLRVLITEGNLPYGDDSEFDWNTEYGLRLKAVQELAKDLREQPNVLAESLAQLSCGEHRMAYEFGKALSSSTESPLDWLETIEKAVSAIVEGQRNYDLLSGFVVGLSDRFPEVLANFKERAAASLDLVPALPRVCSSLGISPEDIDLVIGVLRVGLLAPRRLNIWAHGGALAELPSAHVGCLIDSLLDHSAEAYWVAVNLMGMYSFSTREKLQPLGLQIVKMAENVALWGRQNGQGGGNQARDYYHFKEIMDWMLSNGSQNATARSTALALAKSSIAIDQYNDGLLIKEVFPPLLLKYPEIVWPIVGQAIVSDRKRAALLKLMLGEPYSFSRYKAPLILCLSEETLFAWCYAHPEQAPAFLAELVPILAGPKSGMPESVIHPLMERLLNEFGERTDVLRAVKRNLHTFGWSGSRANYFIPLKQPLTKLLDHPKRQVRRWATATLRDLETAIQNAHKDDEERDGMADF